MSGPVTLTVTPNTGPYNEQVILPVISGTNATNTVTFEGNGNLITSTISSSAFQGVFTLAGADYVKLNNFRIEPNGATSQGWGVQLQNASDNNTITNCTINLPVNSISSLMHGIGAGLSNTNTPGNYANNLLIQDNIINGGYYGITITGTSSGSPITGLRVLGNQLRDALSGGINLSSAGTGAIVEGNDISRPNRIYISSSSFTGIYLAGNILKATVHKNRIHNTSDMTADVHQVTGLRTDANTTPGNENIIKNNLIYNINNHGGTFYGFYNSANGTYYYHNTVVADYPGVTYGVLRAMQFVTAASNVRVINNNLSLPGNATTNKFAFFLQSASIALISNNNNIFIGSTGKIGSIANVDKITFADWQAANSNAYDQNSVSVDPVFVSPAYPQPMATALNNAGQPLATVTEDFNGATRSATTPDIGAYEFTPAVNDAGVTAINSPVSPVTPGSQPVTVTLKNFGSATLTAATIGWSVNNVVQTPYPWTGSLSTFQATATPVTIGNYTFPTGNLKIKVWSQNPNGVADGMTVNDTTILNIVSCAALAGNYTINKNNPTAGTNFQSISEVAQKLNTCGVSAPVTFTVASGTGPYNEQVEIKNIPNASATNTVTFEGNGNTVSVTPGLRPGIFVLNGAKFVKLNNFMITLPATALSGWGVQLVNSADNNTISNNTINLPINNFAPNALPGEINGIIAGNSTASASGSHANNTKIQNNIINGGFYGIQMTGNSGVALINNQITGNQIKDPQNFGIMVGYMNGSLIEDNDISRPTRTNVTSFNGIIMNGPSLNNIISKNRIHNTHDAAIATNNTAYGIYLASAGATVGNENIVKNNVIYNVKNAGGTFYGFYSSNSPGAHYFHNTVLSDPGTNYNIIRGIYFTSATPNMKFINNIINLPSTATTSKHAIYVGTTGMTLVSNNNDLFVGTTGNIGYFSSDFATLANWKTANTNAYDQNSVSVDPVFVAPATGNLKPTSVGVDNLGQPIASVTEDILGAARNMTTPDMGAYEFGVPANDVSIIGVSVSNATSCNMSATDSVTVTIKNLGTNTQTSVPVTYSVNGVAIAAPETYTGTIAPNATATYTFNTKINLATPGTYEVIAKTMLGGDITTNNDADTTSVTNSQISGMPVNLDFETPTTGISKFRKVDKLNSNIIEDLAASNGTTSTKGMIMDGVDNTSWVTPSGANDPWSTNADNFAGVYFCISPAGGAATDSLIMTFDLKQLFVFSMFNTNFRVTVNGVQVGSTYNPPFSGTPINWKKIRIDLTQYKNDPTVQIGLESSVKEAYANGTGTANLLDNIEINRVAVQPNLGVKADKLAAQVKVFPNPSTGIFNVDLPKGKTYELEVTDLTGKVLKKLTAKGGNCQLNLEGTAHGIYLLKVTGDNGSAVRKLIVE